MKRIFFALSALFFVLNVNGQLSAGGSPVSFFGNINDNVAATKIMLPQLNIRELRAESEANAANDGTPYPAGKLMQVNYTMQNSGVWTELNNGARLWRLMVEVPGAVATNLYFRNFFLPEGSSLYIYNTDRTQVIGGFGSHNNHPSGLFVTQHIYNSQFIIEYYQPSGVARPGQFTIAEVGNVYNAPPPPEQLQIRGLQTRDFGSSRSCEVNVNCPDGAGWEKQRDGVVRILMKKDADQYWCSGSLVNNTNFDNTGYILTANHCECIASDNDMNQWVFYFNYQSTLCIPDSKNVEPAYATLEGCQYLASSSNRTQATVVGSDFQLLKLNRAIPAYYNVYFNGWDATGIGSNSGVGIHHPKGDVKKISTYEQALTMGGWKDLPRNDTHWNVSWITDGNNYGLTEAGSSGSPLFNKAGYIIGQLSGGNSTCTLDDAIDSYGRMSLNWTSNGNTSKTQLQPWLDSANTGTLFLHGRYAKSRTPLQDNFNNLSANGGKVVMISSDGTVWGFGDNHYGELGSNLVAPQPVAAQLPVLQNIISIAAGGRHAVAVDRLGEVWTWGSNSYGGLGRNELLNTEINDPIPRRVNGMGPAVMVAANVAGTFVLKRDGTVSYFGPISELVQDDGKLMSHSLKNEPNPQSLKNLTGIVTISSSAEHMLALKADGTVFACGIQNITGVKGDIIDYEGMTNIIVTQVPEISNAVAVSAGAAHSLVLKADGTVWAFGRNRIGELGVNTGSVFNKRPVQIPGIRNAVAIAAGYAHSLVLLADGTVMGFGHNQYGALGTSNFNASQLPAKLPGLKRIVAIAVGTYNSYALDADGKLWAWGSNLFGGLGSRFSFQSQTPNFTPTLVHNIPEGKVMKY